MAMATPGRQRRHGFTLVELLVVIGIIALLISILLPALNKAKQSASKAACLSNLHNIGISLAGYVSTYKGALPEGVDQQRGVTWWSLLAQQMGNKYQAVQNLGATSINDTFTTPIKNIYRAGYDARLGVFKCKDAVDTEPKALTNYSCHPLLMPDMGLTYPAGFPEAALVGQTRTPYRISHIHNPSEIALIYDATQCLTADLSATGSPPVQTGDAAACAYNIDGNRIANSGTGTVGKSYLIAGYINIDLGQPIETGPNRDSPNDPGAGAPYQWANVRYRHIGNAVANTLFVDGHAGSFTYKKQGSANGTTGTTDFLRRNLYVPQP